jgi:hypothetical protein
MRCRATGIATIAVMGAPMSESAAAGITTMTTVIVALAVAVFVISTIIAAVIIDTARKKSAENRYSGQMSQSLRAHGSASWNSDGRYQSNCPPERKFLSTHNAEMTSS